MEKAILVMNMPKNCAECRFSTIGCQDNDICYLNNKEIHLDKKPNWCSLKALPNSIDISGCKTDITKARAQEYNALLTKLSN